jgi:DNA-binding MarR family transcriptional regulator
MTDSLGFLMNRVASAIRTEFERELAPYGVTAQQFPVLRLALELDCPRPSEMAEALGIDRGAVTRLIDRLAEKGLVERSGDPTDLRAARVTLTPRGQTLVPVLMEIARHRNDAALRILEPVERAALIDYLKRMLEKVRQPE